MKVTSSVEETALAVEALAAVALSEKISATKVENVDTKRDKTAHSQAGNLQTAVQHGGSEAMSQAIISGVEFLLNSVDECRHRVPWPIGFYFAKLWYHERLYPLIFTTAALGKFLQFAADKPAFDGSIDETKPLQNSTLTLPEV